MAVGVNEDAGTLTPLTPEEIAVVQKLATAMGVQAKYQLAVYGDFETSQHEKYTLY